MFEDFRGGWSCQISEETFAVFEHVSEEVNVIVELEDGFGALLFVAGFVELHYSLPSCQVLLFVCFVACVYLGRRLAFQIRELGLGVHLGCRMLDVGNWVILLLNM